MTQLAPGFADPVFAAQSTFRAVMEATARPGRIFDLAETVAAPAPLSPGAAALALTLFDQDTPVWLDAPLADGADVAAWLRFHTRAPLVNATDRAAFAVLSQPAETPPFDAFAPGTAEYPDRSTTLILQVDRFEGGQTLALTGPGIKERNTLHATPLPADFPQRLAANRALFPRGIDLLLVTDAGVAALPRSVTLTDEARPCMSR